MPDWRVRTRQEPWLTKGINLSLVCMGAGFLILLLGHKLYPPHIALFGVAIYVFGLALYLVANLIWALVLFAHLADADRVVLKMLDDLWRKERQRLLNLSDRPLDMAAVRGRWIKVQVQVLDRRVATVALLGVAVLGASKVLNAYLGALVEPQWKLFVELLPNLAAFSSAIPALHFHGLAAKLLRVEHQVSEVANAKAKALPHRPLSARSRMRTRYARPSERGS